MTFLELCQQLLPGDARHAIRAFSLEQLKTFQQRFPNTCTQIEAYLQQFVEQRGDLNQPHWAEAFMQYLKNNNNLAHKQFRLELLTIYCLDSAMLQKLGLPFTPLFPQGQTLDNMNFEALEAVFERGPIWRQVD